MHGILIPKVTSSRPPRPRGGGPPPLRPIRPVQSAHPAGPASPSGWASRLDQLDRPAGPVGQARRAVSRDPFLSHSQPLDPWDPLGPNRVQRPGLKDLCQNSSRDDFRQKKISTRSQPGRRRRQGTCADFFRRDGGRRTYADFFRAAGGPDDGHVFFFAVPPNLTTDMCFLFAGLLTKPSQRDARSL
eukprot:gene23112-biopygen5803